MSDYNDDAQKAKAALDSVSPSFCLAKWKQVSLHLPTGQTNSCYHPPLHKIPTEPLQNNPSALHNTEYKKQRRKEMLEGIRCGECSYCWDIEDRGFTSDRHYRSGEPWAFKDFESIKNAPWDADVTPSYVEVNFSNVCNLECSYCSPEFSSSWAIQSKKHGAYPTQPPHNDPAHFEGNKRVIPHREENPYVDAFWRWWPQLYPELKHFRMTGGEPIMDKNTYKVFDYVLENPKPDLHLNVTSNFSVEPALFDKYLDYVKRICDGPNVEHFMQFVSVDTWAEEAEYIRHGLNFNRLQENVFRYLDEVPGRNSITFIATHSALSVKNFYILLQWIDELRSMFTKTYEKVWFDVPILRSPNFLGVDILPESYGWHYKRNTERAIRYGTHFRDFEIEKIRRNQQILLAPKGDNRKQMANFYRYFTEYDRRHGTDITKTFSSMNVFWGECKYWAENL